MKIKYPLLTIILALTLIILSACDENARPDFVDVGKNGSRTDDKVGFQFDKPEEGEEIVVMTTSMGVIKLRIFDKSAPIAAKNFKLLIKQGAYDGSNFHRVIADFMLQGGNTTDGKSAWGDSFGYEFNNNLRHFKGALAMAHSDNPNSNTCQFYIVQNSKLNLEEESVSKALDVFDEDTVKLYKKHGGTPWLDGEFNSSGGHTVFGQVFEGLDIVDKIAAVETKTDESGGEGVPVEEVSIKRIRLAKYEK